jgi:2-oxoglutarate dehydrogenase E2 component (dihydrolipoamide succinyltransferase)
MLRRKVAERLVALKRNGYVNYFQRSKHDINIIRNQYKDEFKAKHGGVGGYMSLY